MPQPMSHFLLYVVLMTLRILTSNWLMAICFFRLYIKYFAIMLMSDYSKAADLAVNWISLLQKAME